MNNSSEIQTLFKSLQSHASLTTIKAVFFDLNNKDYWQYLPAQLKNDNFFIKQALEANLIDISTLSYSDKNDLLVKNLISKTDYINNIQSNPLSIEDNLYPQDERIIVAALSCCDEKVLPEVIKLIDKKLMKDMSIINKVARQNPEIIYCVDAKTSDKVKNNEETMVHIVQHYPQYFHVLKEKQKSQTEFLKPMLKNMHLYKEVKEYLAKNNSDEIALLALKLTKNAVSFLHPKYQKILDGCDNKHNAYIYLKTFLVNQKLRSSDINKDVILHNKI